MKSSVSNLCNNFGFRANNLRLSLIQYQAELNRCWNRDICKNFDEMAAKLGEIPNDTKVSL
jgi:hypothetical protein